MAKEPTTPAGRPCSSLKTGREPRTHRVSFRISDSDYRVFCSLAERGGFCSLSSFLRYLAYCAVRSAGSEYTSSIPEPVMRVFRTTYEHDLQTLAAAVRLVEAGQIAPPAPTPPEISEEVGEMFRTMGDEGARLMFPGDINWRK